MPTTWFRSGRTGAILAVILSMAMLAASGRADAWTSPWRDLGAVAASAALTRRPDLPDATRLLALDPVPLLRELDFAPEEAPGRIAETAPVVSLPLPEGGFARVRVALSPIMEHGLAMVLPHVRTYRCEGVDDPGASGRLAWTGGGLYAVYIGSGETVFVEPLTAGSAEYASYRAGGERAAAMQVTCETAAPQAAVAPTGFSDSPGAAASTGSALRSLRLAIATTGEYTTSFGSVTAALDNGVVPTISAINAIAEREIAVRYVLVANEAALIFTNAATDPYTNGDTVAMVAENPPAVDAAIGSASYDVGHVFGKLSGCCSGGGMAYYGVCAGQYRAGAASNTTTPTGDNWTLLLAHEFGHQLHANHTYNSSIGFCGANRRIDSAVEPGSGSTIMSYAGNCGAENLGYPPDDVYHALSFEEIRATLDGRPTCGTISATGNQAPSVAAGTDETIPANTPFELTASGSDPDGDTLTYSWEQMDVGAASPPMSDDGTRAIIRVFPPSASPTRTVPRLSNLLAGTTAFGEALPTTDRTLDFRATARDGRSGGGGVNSDDLRLTVTTSSGPFAVTSQSSSATWDSGSTQTVTWNVANTTAPPVSAASVDIFIVWSGGTQSQLALAATPNDGSQQFVVPNVSANDARVKVRGSGNVFFDVSSANLTISAGPFITSVDPPSGTTRGGTVVTIEGANFAAGATVAFGALPASNVTIGSSSITATAPAHPAGTVAVTVTNPDTRTGSGSYTYVCPAPPAIAAPASLCAGGTGNASVASAGSGATYVWTAANGLITGGIGTPSVTFQPSATADVVLGVTIAETSGCSAQATRTVGVEPLGISPATLPEATAGIAYTQALAGFGGTGPYTFALTAGAAPNGITLAGDGTLSGTPASVESATFTVEVTDAAGCSGPRDYTLDVVCVTLALASLPQGEVGQPYSQTLTAQGGAAPYTYTVSSGLLPDGLTLDPGGLLSGSPTTGGPASFTISVTDSGTCSGSRPYSLCVHDPTKGDLNLDAIVNATDLVTLANHLVGNVAQGTPPFTAPASAADLDRTSTATATDLVLLANYLVGNLSCLPI